jgi:hypothetical protein
MNWHAQPDGISAGGPPHWTHPPATPSRADRNLWAVLLAWALCTLGLGAMIAKYGSPLPWADEWELTAAATGEVPLTWFWVWFPQNEHRAPLTRLEVWTIGRLCEWDLRVARLVNLGFVSAGALALVFAARALRGRSALSDTFLALAVLNPWQYETILVYFYAYALALGLFCVAVSALAVGWPLRSPAALWLCCGLALAVALAGGPAGNVWAVGLCGFIPRGWIERTSRGWKVHALLGTGLVVGLSVYLLAITPQVPVHDQFQDHSPRALLSATAHALVGWLGRPLPYLWPWVLAVLAVPAAYVLLRVFQDLRRRAADRAGTGPFQWLDVGLLWAATLAVGALIAYGRTRRMALPDSRLCTLLLPIGVVLYLLLVRLRAPAVLLGGGATVMAFCVGWNWPGVLNIAEGKHAATARVIHALRNGSEPLAALADENAEILGYSYDQAKLLSCLLQLREAGKSIFRPRHRMEAVRGMGPSLAWEAETGRLSRGFRCVEDPRATGHQAVEVAEAPRAPAVAEYQVAVPADGVYELSCRLTVPWPDSYLGVRVDDGPTQTFPLTPWQRYYIHYHKLHDPILLFLGAGGHRLTLTVDRPGTRLDLLELIPRRRGLEGTDFAAAP